MPACATHKQTTDIPCSDSLILPVPDTDFRDFLDEVDELVRFAPEIIEEIEKNLDTHARKKKRLRLADREFFESQTGDLPELDITERNMPAEDLDLAVGRPRMSGYAGHLFLMLRGFLGSLTSKPARRILRESMSLHAFLQCRELLTRVLKQIRCDLADAQRVVEYCGGRVFHDQKLPSTEKVLAYNCCRIILMKQRREKRRREEMKRAA